jgi:hypothetical protein
MVQRGPVEASSGVSNPSNIQTGERLPDLTHQAPSLKGRLSRFIDFVKRHPAALLGFAISLIFLSVMCPYASAGLIATMVVFSVLFLLHMYLAENCQRYRDFLEPGPNSYWSQAVNCCSTPAKVKTD